MVFHKVLTGHELVGIHDIEQLSPILVGLFQVCLVELLHNMPLYHIL